MQQHTGACVIYKGFQGHHALGGWGMGKASPSPKKLLLPQLLMSQTPVFANAPVNQKRN